MFKWVVGLCAAIYATLLIFGEPPEGGEAVAAVDPIVESETSKPEAMEEPVVLAIAATPAIPLPADEPVQETAAVVPVAALAPPTVESASLDGASDAPAVDVAAAAPALPEPVEEPVTPSPIETAAVAVDDGVGEIWTVTGSRVNLRTEANTSAYVVGQTTRGDSAEVIELLDNGWARVYIIDLGIEAYMSADFISREG